MRFGVLNISHNRAGADPAVALRDWVDVALEVERLGFWSVWTTEHHFASDTGYRPFGVDPDEYTTVDYDMSPDALTLLAYAAARTSTIRLATGVTVLHWDHPLKVAERAAMLDVLSGGRLELGVGRGLGAREAQAFAVPVDADENRRRYEEAVEILQLAWSGERFSYDGEFFSVPPVTMTPNPGRPAPIFVGSGSLDSAAYAGARGLPYATITWPLLTLAKYREKLDHYRATAVAAGHDVSDQPLPHFFYMYCGESDAEASEVGFHRMQQLQYILENHYELKRQGAAQMARLGMGADQDDAEVVARLARFPVEHHLIGSADTIAERVRALEDELDLNYCVAITGFGAMPKEQSLASLRRFGEHVLPRFAATPVA
ncbi:MAG TPA: LLM class flavin-dependent oxidoreductase [Baekduia sp.]